MGVWNLDRERLQQKFKDLPVTIENKRFVKSRFPSGLSLGNCVVILGKTTLTVLLSTQVYNGYWRI